MKCLAGKQAAPLPSQPLFSCLCLGRSGYEAGWVPVVVLVVGQRRVRGEEKLRGEEKPIGEEKPRACFFLHHPGLSLACDQSPQPRGTPLNELPCPVPALQQVTSFAGR